MEIIVGCLTLFFHNISKHITHFIHFNSFAFSYYINLAHLRELKVDLFNLYFAIVDCILVENYYFAFLVCLFFFKISFMMLLINVMHPIQLTAHDFLDRFTAFIMDLNDSTAFMRFISKSDNFDLSEPVYSTLIPRHFFKMDLYVILSYLDSTFNYFTSSIFFKFPATITMQRLIELHQYFLYSLMAVTILVLMLFICQLFYTIFRAMLFNSNILTLNNLVNPSTSIRVVAAYKPTGVFVITNKSFLRSITYIVTLANVKPEVLRSFIMISEQCSVEFNYEILKKNASKVENSCSLDARFDPFHNLFSFFWILPFTKLRILFSQFFAKSEVSSFVGNFTGFNILHLPFNSSWVFKYIQFSNIEVNFNFFFDLYYTSLFMCENYWLEFWWTVIPFCDVMLLLFPTLAEIFEEQHRHQDFYHLNIKVLGHQWYWSFHLLSDDTFATLSSDTFDNDSHEIFTNIPDLDFSDNVNNVDITTSDIVDIITSDSTTPDNVDLSFLTFSYLNLPFNFEFEFYNSFDMYMINSDLLLCDDIRYLSVDRPLIIPINHPIRFIITSLDVLHSFALPALGVKLDACPGRLNQVHSLIQRSGTFYGQCSELCGIGHGFMPITVYSVNSSCFATQSDYLSLFATV